MEFDKLPPLLQGAALIGAFIAGIGAWILGTRRKQPAEETRDNLQAELDDAKLRSDLEKILAANREAFFKALKNVEDGARNERTALEGRLRTVEQEVAVLKEARRRRRPS